MAEPQKSHRHDMASILGRIVYCAQSPLSDLMKSIERVAGTRANVLVTGESGVGKEMIVRALHDLAPWANGPYVPINCGAIPEALLESELFGYVRGAFTGADRSRMGRLEAANGGTLFLDEIGDMPLHLQVKLLRVLQEREFEPLGSTERRKATFRVVTATNRHLEDAVVQGQFRQDLFFRLDVVRLHIPALRERPMDIGPLAEYFLVKYRESTGSRVDRFTDAALAVLERHDWPGNVRELENVVQSILVLKETGPIQAEDVSAKIQGRTQIPITMRAGHTIELPAEGLNLKEALERLEQQLIRQALKRSNGNKAAAATLLGINRTTLVEKLKRNLSV